MVTLVVTPAESALDNEPAISNSEGTNRIDSITHDGVDKIVYDQANLTINELTDINNLLVDLGIRWPLLNSPKTKETSLCLATVVDSIVGPFIINNEHLDKSLQGSVDKCIEQAGKDD